MLTPHSRRESVAAGCSEKCPAAGLGSVKYARAQPSRASRGQRQAWWQAGRKRGRHAHAWEGGVNRTAGVAAVAGRVTGVVARPEGSAGGGLFKDMCGSGGTGRRRHGQRERHGRQQ